VRELVEKERKQTMKKSFFVLLAAVLMTAGGSWAQLVGDLDDLNYWGTGANRAAFVVQWNDSKSPDALAWGYRWDGTQTVTDMLLFLAANDPRLFARIDSATGFGLGIFGLGYQTGSATFGLTGAVDVLGDPVPPVFIAGVDDLNTNPASTQSPASSTFVAPLNAVDRYSEGWNDNGFWELYHSGSSNSALEASFSLPATWTASWVGSSVTLVDESWAVFSISNPDFSSNLPTSNVVAAIPEPSSFLLVGLGAWLLALRRRKA
jgi:hypothetical protein